MRRGISRSAWSGLQSDKMLDSPRLAEISASEIPKLFFELDDFKALKAFMFETSEIQICGGQLIFDSDTSRAIDMWIQPLGDFANNLIRT